LFHNANLFGSCIIHILYTGCAKIKKNNSGAKGLTEQGLRTLSFGIRNGGVKMTTHYRSVSWLRMNGALPPHLLFWWITFSILHGMLCVKTKTGFDCSQHRSIVVICIISQADW